MKSILMINAGSTSLKWKIFDLDTNGIIEKGDIDQISRLSTSKDEDPYEIAMNDVINDIKASSKVSLNDIQLIAHRIVSGGPNFDKPMIIDKELINAIKEYNESAPLHNPTELRCAEIMEDILPDIKQIAVFDSSFFLDMPEENSIYSIPYELTQKYNIHKYGEHGINHSYLNRRLSELMNKDKKDLKTVTIHLGGGASVASSKNGHAFNTSMGFSPSMGLIMGTRSGDLDPSIIQLLMKHEDMTIEQAMNVMNKESGLKGISGIGQDMRDITSNFDNKRAKLAYDMFINKIIEYTAAFIVELDGVDAIAFSGGIGEHNPDIRRKVIDRLFCLGISIDDEKNNSNQDGLISSKDSKTKVYLIPANEELEMLLKIKPYLNEFLDN